MGAQSFHRRLNKTSSSSIAGILSVLFANNVTSFRRRSSRLGAPQIKESSVVMKLQLLKISGVGKMGISQKFETQHGNSFKIIYFQRGWLILFVF